MQEEDGEDEYDGEHHDNEGVTEIRRNENEMSGHVSYALAIEQCDRNSQFGHRSVE